MGGILRNMGKVPKDKAYKKALKYYEEGNLDKAVEYCNKSIARNLKNSAVLNLKGLILYIKGNLNEARTQWKINLEYNNNTIAKNYLNDSKSDMEREKLYKKVDALIRNLQIDEAILILNKCKESDFNAINVSLSLALCYQRKGDIENCSFYVSKVLNMDKKNKHAIKMAKELKNLSGIKLEAYKEKSILLKLITIGGVATLVILLAVGIKFIIINNQQELKNNEQEIVNNVDNVDNSSEEVDETVNYSEEIGKTNSENIVNMEEIQKLIDDKNYKELYIAIKNIDEGTLSGKDKTVYYNAKELLENEGVDSLYKKGLEVYNEKNYVEAKDFFEITYDIGKESYLYPHIVFLKAVTYEELKDIENAIKTYEEYYNNYNTGDYIIEVTYKLALLYKTEDIDKSISFAQEIKDKYSDSMYNNGVISNLLD